MFELWKFHHMSCKLSSLEVALLYLYFKQLTLNDVLSSPKVNVLLNIHFSPQVCKRIKRKMEKDYVQIVSLLLFILVSFLKFNKTILLFVFILPQCAFWRQSYEMKYYEITTCCSFLILNYFSMHSCYLPLFLDSYC
jgi:hypothetical protein